MEEQNSDPVDRTLEMCRRLWADYRSGAVDYDTLPLDSYTKEYRIGKVPKLMIAPILLKRTEPTEEDAVRFRTEANSYRMARRYPDKEGEKQELMTEKEAIAVLKRKGYRVMKKTTAYIDV